MKNKAKEYFYVLWEPNETHKYLCSSSG